MSLNSQIIPLTLNYKPRETGMQLCQHAKVGYLFTFGLYPKIEKGRWVYNSV